MTFDLLGQKAQLPSSLHSHAHQYSKILLLPLLLSIAAFIPEYGQADGDHLEAKQVTDNIYMLSGSGGNIGVMVGDEGTFLIDDQMANVAPDLMATIGQLGGEFPRFLINTHFHFDHTGGNEILGLGGATIFSHNNARTRLADGSNVPIFDLLVPPAPDKALPVVTFDDTMNFHLNGETLRAVHVPKAHTDGDVVIFFEGSNVVHAGDIFFNGIYPVIDTHNGGSLQGMIDAAEMLLDATDAKTKFIPGHGPLGSRSDLQDYLGLLLHTRDRLERLKRDGKNLEQVISSKPLAEFDAKWGAGFIPTDVWIGMMYQSL